MKTIIKILVILLFLALSTSCVRTNVTQYFSSDQYIVQKGDTLTTIAFRYKMNVRNLFKWNKLSANSKLTPGQRIYVKEPNKSSSEYNTIVENKNKTTTKSKRGITSSKKWTKKPKTKQYVSYKNKYNWNWPVPNNFNRSSKKTILKGLSFTGKVGQNVAVVSPGTVIYSGNGLKKYGNLVIVKHNNQLLSAYAFNKKNLVKEKDKVKKGQVIATMGSKNKKGHLYFEIRKNGKPINPLYYLKPR